MNEASASLYNQYMDALRTLDTPLAILVGDMMHWSANQRPTINEVIQRLRTMQPSAIHKRQIVESWQELPQKTLAVQKALMELDANLERIAREQLKPINSK